MGFWSRLFKFVRPAKAVSYQPYRGGFESYADAEKYIQLLKKLSDVAKITHKSKSNRSWQRKRRCWARKIR